MSSCERITKSIERRKGRVMGRWRAEKVAHHSECCYRGEGSWVEDRYASCEGMSGDGGQNDTPRWPCAPRLESEPACSARVQGPVSGATSNSLE